jgi:hypothetical protein
MRIRLALMGITLIAAGTCAYFGAEAYYLASRSSQEPEEISLQDLIKRGSEGNPNIILKDFVIFDDFVYEKKALSARWTRVWVPVVPSNEAEKASGKAAIRVFLYSENVGNEKEARARFEHPKMRGLVNPNAPKPGIIGSVLIKRSYPGTDPSRCIMIEEGLEPAGPLKLLMYALGVALFLGMTGGIWYLARQFDKMEVPPTVTAADDQSGTERSH